MGKPRYDPPTEKFPYRISKRLNAMSVPRPTFVDNVEDLPAVTPRGIRRSALRGRATERINEAAWPYLRRFFVLKHQCRNFFSNNRLRRIDRMIEATNGTMYSKLASCKVDLKNTVTEMKKNKKAWSEADWKKHMDYINQISTPRREFKPPPVTVRFKQFINKVGDQTNNFIPRDVKRGARKPLDELLMRINEISNPAQFKIYKRISKERWYKNPIKVASAAKRYVASDRVKVLATPRALRPPE